MTFNKDAFLLPKMVPFPLVEGLYFKELGGDALYSFRSCIDDLKRGADKDAELQPHQAADLMARFVVLSACDEQGNCVFTEDDLPRLREKNLNLLSDMANTAMPLSGMSAVALSGVAVDLKNAPPDSSISDLQKPLESQ